MNKITIFLSILFFLALNSSYARNYHIVSLEWPPFTCFNCPNKGITIPIIEDVFKESGDVVTVDVVPWSRAKKMINDGSAHYLWPSWPSDVEGSELVISKAVFDSPLVVVMRKDNLIQVNKLEDLLNYKIGIVQDYGYYSELTDLIKKYPKKFESVTKDLSNVEKLKKKRVDAIIIDKSNFNFLNKDQKIGYEFKQLTTLPLVMAGNKKDIEHFDEILKKYQKKNNIQKIINKKLQELSFLYILREKENLLGAALFIPTQL